jgi:Domain of unknown function (DUF1707)
MDRAGWSYPTGDLRVSDADRDRALAELSEAFQLGRITAEEFDQRSGQALSSRTGKELTALLADLPAERAGAEPVLATRTTAPDPANRVLAMRIAFAAAIAAICFGVTAAGAAISSAGPTVQQRELLRALAARQGLRVPVFPAHPAFDWVGTITPATIAVLLVVLIIYLRVRVARISRP